MENCRERVDGEWKLERRRNEERRKEMRGKRRCPNNLELSTSLLTLEKSKALQELEGLRRPHRVYAKKCAKRKKVRKTESTVSK